MGLCDLKAITREEADFTASDRSRSYFTPSVTFCDDGGAITVKNDLFPLKQNSSQEINLRAT